MNQIYMDPEGDLFLCQEVDGLWMTFSEIYGITYLPLVGRDFYEYLGDLFP